jgi:hypothetical protein
MVQQAAGGQRIVEASSNQQEVECLTESGIGLLGELMKLQKPRPVIRMNATHPKKITSHDQ